MEEGSRWFQTVRLVTGTQSSVPSKESIPQGRPDALGGRASPWLGEAFRAVRSRRQRPRSAPRGFKSHPCCSGTSQPRETLEGSRRPHRGSSRPCPAGREEGGGWGHRPRFWPDAASHLHSHVQVEKGLKIEPVDCSEPAGGGVEALPGPSKVPWCHLHWRREANRPVGTMAVWRGSRGWSPPSS